jgi:hypothetical protein
MRLGFRLGRIASNLRAAEDAVAITLDLKPEVEAELTAQAQAAGLSLAQFLSRELEAMRKRSNARTGIPTVDNAGEDEDSRRYEYSAPRNSEREPAKSGVVTPLVT